MKIYKKDLAPAILLPTVLFLNILLTQFSLPSYTRYCDEAFSLIVGSIFFVKVFKNKKLSINKFDRRVVYCVFLTIIIGLSGNLIWGYADSFNAVFRDIVQYIKFPITYLAIKYSKLGYDCSAFCRKRFEKFIKFAVTVIFFLGCMTLFMDIGMSQNEIRSGIRPYQFLFGHPTSLVICCVLILALLEYEEKYQTKGNAKYILMILGIIALSMRTKGLMVIAAFIFIKYTGKWFYKFKILYWFGIAIVVFAAAYSKLELYFSFSGSGRMSLYTGSLELILKCFPIGSGFATYASHISGRYYSHIYDFIYIPEVWVNGTLSNVLGDTGYPYYIGQFGVLGTILFLIMIYSIYRSFSKNNLAALIIIIYILVALTSESTLASYGV